MVISASVDAFPKKMFASHLIDWYKAHYRRLPWRETKNPYFIWLSEIMLQQTQVKTVMGYYERFIQAFPTLADLAKADPKDVMKQWEGLGYYSRCRNLHKAAKMIVEEHNGSFPQSMEAVSALPGIGKSTAGAILTFAFDQRHPLLDGNVKRVLSRLFNIDSPVEATKTINCLWAISAELIEAADVPYYFNQGIMELGATLCLPKKPHCLLCPFNQICQSYLSGSVHERPVKLQKKVLPHYNIAAGILWNDQEEVFVQQRPEGGLLGGLWEFPGGKQEPGEVIQQTLKRELNEELGIQIKVLEALPAIKHAYTHFKITLFPFHCKIESGSVTPTVAQDWQWLKPEKLESLAFPKANKVILTWLKDKTYWPSGQATIEVADIEVTDKALL
ncbi:MAG: A/G-specific adenine glycosylase [Cyanobacteria bacterium P01_H01_bin.74]